MAKRISRREFLRGTAAGAVSLAVSGVFGGVSGVMAEEEDTTLFDSLTEAGVVGWKTLEPDTSRELASPSNRYPLVTEANISTVASLTPFTTETGSNVATSYYVYETLLVQTGVDEYAPLLAKDYYYEDDTTVVFELYDYITDTDGNNLTASDVVFSYEEFIASGYATDFDYYDYAEAVDDYTVKFHLNGSLESSLTAFDAMFTRTQIVTEKAYNDHNMVTDPVGTGPYYVSEYVSGSSVNLEVNENYWQTEDLWGPMTGQNVQTIHYDFGMDSTTKTLALIAGQSAFSELATTELSDFLEGGKYDGMYNIYSNTGVRVMEFLPNCSEDSPLHDINLRFACFYAIDSETIHIARGADTSAAAVVDASPGVADYQEEWNSIESYQTTYDPDLAKEYLAKSSYNGETLKVLYPANGNGAEETATVIQGFLMAVGIKCELCPYDAAILTDLIKDSTEWDFYLQAQGNSTYVISRLLYYYSTTYGTVEGKTLSFIDDAEFEEMLQACATKTGYSAEATTELINYILDNAYGYATCYVMDISAWNKDMASLAYMFYQGHYRFSSSNWYMD